VTEVLVALIVGASTLGGVVLTQRSERKRAAADRAHDQLVRKQERRHSAYLELMALCTDYSLESIAQLRRSCRASRSSLRLLYRTRSPGG
jgi:hypothetical protein